uniref:hypothetical protein n=1 Tax=Agathobacter sp. TaxID=2021311 RepID=UPI004056ADAF
MNIIRKSKTRRKREYIDWKFTEKLPLPKCWQVLRGSDGRWMEDGFGVAVMNGSSDKN